MSMSAAEVNLNWLLRPLAGLLANPALTNLYIINVGQGMQRMTLPYSFADYEDIAINAAAMTGQDIGRDVPLVMTKFPGGHRVQIVRPPATAEGCISFSIRRPSEVTWTPLQLEAAGVFDQTKAVDRGQHERFGELLGLYEQRQWRAFLELAIRCRLNTVFTGEVDTGKTFNMRSFTHAIPTEWRIVTVEDTQELISLPCFNVVNLLYSKGGQSTANITAIDLVEAALRMGMDGLIVQELRDEAAFSYYNVLNSGHWTMTSCHADSASDVFRRISGLVKQHPAGRQLDEADLNETLRRSIHVVVHSVRSKATGERRVEQVYWEPGMGLGLAEAAE